MDFKTPFGVKPSLKQSTEINIVLNNKIMGFFILIT